MFTKALMLIMAGDVHQVPYYQDANVTMNVFDNATSQQYYKNAFIRAYEAGMKTIRYPDGLGCTFVLDEASRTIRGVCSDRNQREYLVTPNRQPMIPNAQGMDFDQDGNLAVLDGRFCHLFTLSSDRTSATAGKTFMVPMPGNASSVLFLNGLTSQGQKYQRIAIATEDGFVGLFQMSGKRDTIWHLPVKETDGEIHRLFGDGTSTNGIFDFYGIGMRQNLGWWSIRWNPDLRILDLSSITMLKNDSTQGLILPKMNGGEFPFRAGISSLVPIYHGTNEPTMLVMINEGDIYEFSADGVYISTPLQQSVISVGMPRNSINVPRLLNGSQTSPPLLASCNTRDNWQQCLEIVSADDFNGGGGLRRFTYTPPNYGSYIPVNLYCVRADHPGDGVTKPSVGLQNTSYFDAIRGLKIRLFGSRQEMPSQQVAADLYYSRIPGVTLTTGYLDANPNIWWVDIAFPTSFVLNPGDSIATSDLQLGIHFQGYYPGVWDATNDWSFDGPTSLRGGIYAWDSASHSYSLVGGTVPDPSVAPLPVQHPASAVLSLSASQWTVQSGNTTLQAADTGLLAVLQGYAVVATQPLDPSTISFSSGTISVQYELLSPVPNPWWPGSIDLSFNSPMNGIYNQYVGHVNIANTPNQVLTAQFPLPSVVVGRNWTASDFQFLLALNGPPGTRLVIQKITLP